MLHVSRWNVGLALVVVAALSMLLIGQASAGHGGVHVSVTPAVLSFDLTLADPGFGTVALDTTVNTLSNTPNAPKVTNTGSVVIGLLTVDYAGGASQQATCGLSSWDARDFVDGAAVDDFNMRARDDTTTFQNIPKDGTGSADLITVTPIPVSAGSFDVELEFTTPKTVTTGADECTIDLTITAAVS